RLTASAPPAQEAGGRGTQAAQRDPQAGPLWLRCLAGVHNAWQNAPSVVGEAHPARSDPPWEPAGARPSVATKTSTRRSAHDEDRATDIRDAGPAGGPGTARRLQR